ncbi:MAG: hypothetical protein ACYDD2_04295 [Candidatus Acidiferrales bacterium]
MPRKKTKLDFAAAKAAEIIQAHLETLPPAEARAARKEIHGLASRSANREKASRSRKSADSRRLSRVSAESA